MKPSSLQTAVMLHQNRIARKSELREFELMTSPVEIHLIDRDGNMSSLNLTDEPIINPQRHLLLETIRKNIIEHLEHTIQLINQQAENL